MSLSLTEVTAAYAEVPALREVSVELPRGELIAVIGPNGSGKSTLLRALVGVMSPKSGSVQLDDRTLTAWPRRERARHIGYLPQEMELAFPMRAIDVVLSGRTPFLGRLAWEGDADLEASRHALRLCDAEHLAERTLDAMSGGERKRVFLSRVLAGEPDYILLDEPFAALDVAHVEALAHLFRRLVDEERKCVVFVSHDFNWAAAVSDRVIVMKEGRIVADGQPAQVLTVEAMQEVFGIRAEILHGGSGVGWIVPRLQPLG